MESPTTNPYLMDAPPESPERVLLARAFEHYCLLQWGSMSHEIPDALTRSDGTGTASAIRDAARLLGGLIARDRIRSWARPFGGGNPVRLRASAWELDDFSARFASSAIDPDRPFDRLAEPTHWIFVDLDDWNAVLEASVSDLPPRAAAEDPKLAKPVPDQERDQSPVPPARLVRFREVMSRTGLSRSTVYRRMDLGTFPRNVPMSGNVTVWREDEIVSWLMNPS